MDTMQRLTQLVGAITNRLKPLAALVGTTGLTTSAQTLTGAVNELRSGKADSASVYTKAQTDSALSGKQNTTDPLDASRLTGDIDPARIPVINYFKAHVSTAATIATLSSSDQAKITNTGKSGTFNAVTLSDGSTYVYSGGTKTDPASYTLLSDVSPDWQTIANKPDVAVKADIGPDTDFVALFNAQMA